MNFLSNSMDQLREDEGLKLKVYSCPAGKLTIGYGRNLESNGISLPEAEFLLENDVERCWSALVKSFPYINDISDKRKMVLINIAFNVGVEGERKFINLMNAISKNDFQTASMEILRSMAAVRLPSRYARLSNDMKEG